jgi:hypothetical protein
MTKMRDSRVLRKLRAGESASCLKLNIGDGQAAEIAQFLRRVSHRGLCGIGYKPLIPMA